MYTVLVAEDEPLALKTICSVIDRKCPDYKVIATAQNGVDALRIIRQKKPDLVVSDIKMPRPTGIELAAIIRDELPDICVIIISGYQDFEYTQSAIRSGVTDYLLKPIVPDTLENSLLFASERIKIIQYHARNRLLRQMGRAENVDTDELKRYFPYERYYGVLIRANGLPQRFNIDRIREIYSDISEQYVVFGRDEMEGLYLIPEELIAEGELPQYIEKIRKTHVSRGYSTTIYSSRSIYVSELSDKVRQLYRTLDFNSTVGLSQTIELTHSEAGKEPYNEKRREAESFLQHMEVLAGTGKSDVIGEELRRLITDRARNIPQLWLENFARELLSILRRNGMVNIPLSECEYLMSDVFYTASSLQELAEGLIELFLGGEEEKQSRKADSQEGFDSITGYLDFHLNEPLSLQEICDKFGISQAYMSKLFRKYASTSFNKYLTERRMSRAQELFRENPGQYIKEVAHMVGYDDQFYFSRIFRSYTGRSPSEYLKELYGEKA